MKEKSNTKYFPVVCVGGSAGGLDAYIRLLKHLPSDMGVAIVIVNHLRTVATLLHEILPHYTKMPVELITERLALQANRVFIIPPQRDLHVLDGEFRLKPISKPRGWPAHSSPHFPRDIKESVSRRDDSGKNRTRAGVGIFLRIRQGGFYHRANQQISRPATAGRGMQWS